MEDWILRIYVQTQALLVEIEAMKVANLERLADDKALAYDENAFYAVSRNLNDLANQLA